RIPPRVAVHRLDREMPERRRVARLPGRDREHPPQTHAVVEEQVLRVAADDDDRAEALARDRRRRRGHPQRDRPLAVGADGGGAARSRCRRTRTTTGFAAAARTASIASTCVIPPTATRAIVTPGGSVFGCGVVVAVVAVVSVLPVVVVPLVVPVEVATVEATT